jgi:general secretion pathway protein F
VVAALIYPALLTLTSLAIVTGLLVYVVPQVVRVFDSFGGELPLLTRILISISDFMRNGGIYILLAAGVFFIVVMPLLLRNEKRRFIWHRWVLRMPLFGRLAVGVNTARFTRTLSILIASGVPLLEAFHVAAAVLSNLPMRAAVVEAAARVREGAGIFHSLNKTKFFPPMTLHLIASGESSGRLEEMLERAAHALEREQESWLTTLVRILEPAMILIMGGVVLVIVLAIMLPIFQMNKMIG